METFNAFVENPGQAGSSGGSEQDELPRPRYAARIAVYDDMAVPPRVVVVEPKDTAAYLQEIVDDVYELMMQQGGSFPYQTIREIVENFIHAQFIEPVISVLDHGETLVFSDQGPGIPNKAAAMKPSFTTATREMKRYIRGVGSGLPQVEDLMRSRGGTVTIEDNLGHGTIVTISMAHAGEEAPANPAAPAQPQASIQPQAPAGYPVPAQGYGYAQPAQPATQQQTPPPAYAGYGYQQPQPVYPAYAQYPAYGQPPAMPAQPQQPAYAYAPAPQAYAPQAMPAYPYPPQGAPQAPEAATPQTRQPHITQSHLDVLKLFASDQRVGPSLITELLGMPAPTGSRRLKDLAAAGYVRKAGQQYELTPAGAQLLSTLEQ